MQISSGRYRKLLGKYLKPQWTQVLFLSFLLFGGVGLELANPQILRYFIDTARQGGALEQLTLAAALYIGVMLLHQLVAVGAQYTSEKVAWRATNALREDLALHCLHLDLSFHQHHTPGALIERLDGDVAALANFFSQFVLRIVGNVLLLAGVLAMLCREDWRVAAVLALFDAVMLAVLYALRNIAVPAWTAARQASAELYGFLEEQLGGFEDIRANGAVAYVMRQFYKLSGARLERERGAAAMNFRLRASLTVFDVLGGLAGLLVAYYLYRTGNITIGTVFLIVSYARTMLAPLTELTRQMEDLQRASASIERIDELYSAAPAVVDGSGLVFAAAAPAVEFSRVSFGYNEEEKVLEDLSFRLEPGKVLGLLGRTGSGKSTIARLLFRFSDPQEGTVLLGGEDIRQARLDELRPQIGMVAQNAQLLRASIRDNLTFFDRDVDDRQILQVIEDVGLGEWLRRQPDALDAVLESGGGGLSAGEAQLLTFGRVFLKDPGLVILDEASSRLDPTTEQLIERAVDKLLAGRTAIVIAHRLATVQRADEILILDSGRIAEFGKRESLANDTTSRFAQLLRTGLAEVAP